MKLLKIYEIIRESLPSLSKTSLVLCFKNLFLASCLTLALIGFYDCCDFWKNLGTFLNDGSDSYYFLFASSMYCKNNLSV